ncbi:MAG TPA: 4Fe-4S dicluster domain-containing protein [Candidatus Anoxymicrobiaceae bacterium]
MNDNESRLDLKDFARELTAASNLDLDISCCYGCARCSSVCKVAIFGGLKEPLTPRSLLYRAIIGNPSELLSSEFIWLCSGCQRCEEACPQGVKISEVVRTFRRLASESGIANPVAARVNERVCMHCGACVHVCPNNAIELVVGGPKGIVARVDPLECRGCGGCSSVCTNNAIQQNPSNYIEILEKFVRR